MLSGNERQNEIKRRSGAGSAELPTNGGNVKSLLSLGDRLLVVGDKTTYHVLPPEQVDPNVTAKNVPWVMMEEFAFGASSPIISRTLLQFRSFDSCAQYDKTIVPMISAQLEKCVHYLADCQSVLDAYLSELESVKKEVQSGLSRGGSAIHLPKVRNYEYLARSFFYAAKLAFLHSMKMYSQVPDWGSKAQGSIQRIVFALERDKSFADEFVALIRPFERSAWMVAEIRNAIEHPKENYFVEFKNVRYMPTAQLMAPTWTLHHPKISEFSGEIDFAAHAQKIIDRVIEFVEYSLICLLKKCAVGPFEIDFVEFPDFEQRDPKIRFGCNIVLPNNQ